MTAALVRHRNAARSPLPETPIAVRARPRVAYVMSRFPKLTETFVLREMVELEKSGVEIAVYPLQRERTDTIHSAAIPYVERACFTPWISPQILSSNVRSFLRSPARYLATLGTLLRANLGCPRFLAGAIAFFPKIVHLAERMKSDGVTHLHAHFASHPAMAAWAIRRLAGIPYSFTAHGSDLHRDRHMLREKVADARWVIAISDYNRRMILNECGEESAGKVRVVHCGINPHEFPPRAVATSFERGVGPVQIVCIGTLHEVKGQRYLLEACRLMKQAGLDFRCRFIGDGPDRESLNKLTAEFHLRDRVEFCGSRTAEELRRLLAECDIIAAPSVPTSDGRREGIPVVLMEGLGTGLAAVASRLSGIPELVRDEETGLLVPPRDADALAAAILRLAHNPELRRRLARNGCQLVQQEFDVVKNAAALREILCASPDREDTTCPI